jgi:formylglycine-generating enzyme required for sulfatase activity/DNA-binding winged helix-turn-helix (wHTH) protein
MGDIVHKVLWFDRFALDLARGCLRLGEQEIELRPKAFEVLRYLAVHAGALVPKQDLYAAVWPNITVSDDSLVQCIRELRQKLGDHEHRLIKTVSRRGYLLDAMPRTGDARLARTPAHSAAWRSGSALPRARDWVSRRIAAILMKGRLPRAPSPQLLVVAIAVLIGATASVHLLLRGRTTDTSVATQPKSAATRFAPYIAPATFKDCDLCPEMAPLPAGEFMMGAPRGEVGRRQTEGPRRRVTIARGFAIGKFEVTIDQFSAFVDATRLAAGNTCQILIDNGNPGLWTEPKASFRQPGFEVTGSHPAVCISGHDAQAYAAWLKRRTGRPYRLPTEAEWEYAARAGTTTAFSFGMDETELCGYARFADLSSSLTWRGGCRSGRPGIGTMPVGSLKPNPWGLADMHGNAWEWVEDCWSPDVRKLPTDGSAFMRPGGCEIGVIRGGGFGAGPVNLRSAHRRSSIVARHYNTVGFRVALSLDAQ